MKRNSKGFTLLEILIAVAIIAIISAAVAPMLVRMRTTAQVNQARNEVDAVAAAYAAYQADYPTNDLTKVTPGGLVNLGYLEIGKALPNKVELVNDAGRFYVRHLIQKDAANNVIQRELGKVR